ncbi:unnamed protein product [Closterium sp. NIES-54]
MALLRVLAFDHEGRPVAFDTWHDDLQLYLLSDIKDSVLQFDHVSGVAPTPPATADGATRPVRCCRCSLLLPATAALGQLLLPYLFPELSAFATVADLVTHLRTSDARYRATVPAEFLPTNQPPMFITLYFIVSCLPDSLRCVRDHFLSLDPPRSVLTSSSSIPSQLRLVHLLAKRRSSKGKGGRDGGGDSVGGEGGSGSGGGGSGGGGGGSRGGGGGGTGGSSGGSDGGGGGSRGSGGSGGGGSGGGWSGPWRVGPGVGQRQQ